jgi:ethanolamine ammonia-lyase small subunit
VSDLTQSRPDALPTTARLSLGRTGTTVATSEHLHFQLDHALARDAVHTPLDTALLERGLRERGLMPLLLRSNAADRKTYLRRPDLGRTLHPDSVERLRQQNATPANVLLVLADGLSALALEGHALPLLDATLPLLEPGTLNLAPVVQNARVALGDQVGALLGAQITVLLIGERPGLSSPDSLGCYITWNPQPGITTDAERNCISNIRGAEGLSYAEAAHRIAHYLREAQRLNTTGIALKDPTAPLLSVGQW